jgi:hypothetical protein
MLRSKSNRLAYRFYQNAQRRIEAAKQAAEAGGEAAGLPTDQQKGGTAAREASQEEITIVVDRDRKDKERPAVFVIATLKTTTGRTITAGIEIFEIESYETHE